MEDRQHHKLARMFKDILYGSPDERESRDSRWDEKAANYYVKGRGGMTREKENKFNKQKEYSSDPDME